METLENKTKKLVFMSNYIESPPSTKANFLGLPITMEQCSNQLEHNKTCATMQMKRQMATLVAQFHGRNFSNRAKLANEQDTPNLTTSGEKGGMHQASNNLPRSQLDRRALLHPDARANK
jgi:hypothetical protein